MQAAAGAQVRLGSGLLSVPSTWPSEEGQQADSLWASAWGFPDPTAPSALLLMTKGSNSLLPSLLGLQLPNQNQSLLNNPSRKKGRTLCAPERERNPCLLTALLKAGPEGTKENSDCSLA